MANDNEAIISGTPVSIRNIGTSGVIMDNVVDEILTPSGAVSWAINLHFDRIGAASTRPGSTIIGSSMGASQVLGLHQFLDTGAGTNDQLVAVVGTVLYYNASGTWTSRRTSLTTGKKARFTNFVDYLFMVNGAEAMATWTGATGDAFSTSTNVTSAPIANYIDNFRTRVWAARTSGNPSRLYYSSVADASYAILWTGSDSSYIDIAPNDGEDITGIKKFVGALYVFKPSSIYRVFSINQTEPDPIILTGTYSQESVATAKDGMYWHHSSGFYRLAPGGTTPQEISRPINDIVRAITRSNYDNVSGWSDSDHVSWSVGDVSVYGITIRNCVVRWTISTQLWTIYSYPTQFYVGATYGTGSAITKVVGDSAGSIFTIDSGTTDNGTSIKYELEMRWLMLSGLRAEKKTVRTLSAINENMEGAKLGWRNGTMGRNQIQPIGQIDSQESLFQQQDIFGSRVKFSIRGESKGATAVYQGLELLEWMNEGYGALER